jgi:hypothetical protein
MDMDQYRHHLSRHGAKKGKISASIPARKIAVRLLDLQKYLSNEDRLEEIDRIHKDLKTIPKLNTKNKDRIHHNLRKLQDALKMKDFKEAEILIASTIDILVKH